MTKKKGTVNEIQSETTEDQEVTNLNLWQRINGVRSEVRAVAKDKQVGDGNFAYNVATHEGVNNMLRPLLVKWGLVDYVDLHKRTIVDTGKRYGKSQNIVIRYEGRYKYIVVNVDNPDEKTELMVEGHGEDAGDKAPGKASTYAIKTGRNKVFAITTGEDEEGRIADDQLSKPGMEPMDPEQLDELLRFADELFGEDADEKVERMCDKIFDVKKAAEIPAKHYDHAMSLLKNQAKREGKIEDEPEQL